MVSLQSSNSPKGSKTALFDDLDGSSNNKRKWNHDDESLQTNEGFFGKRLRSPTKPVFEIELQLETPLPLEWQRCLDIQSGQIHFYNTRTKKRTSMDPRRSIRQEAEPQTHMSLDLELNLPCDSQRQIKHNFGSSIMDFGDLMKDSSNKLENKKNNTSFEGDIHEEEEEGEEMVAIVCERCHLLVMLCKSSPSCPNCKFMHSIDDHNFTNYQFKPTLLASCVTYL
ncbi:hypothetical protein M5689_025136 [Euphorbia peplus]|nr:hypothetical protein M5689_025136 [Euphorbia peplus]